MNASTPMRRLGRFLLFAGPWIGLAVVVWREQTLEAELAKFVAAANESVQVAVRNVVAQVEDAMEVVSRGGGDN